MHCIQQLIVSSAGLFLCRQVAIMSSWAWPKCPWRLSCKQKQANCQQRLKHVWLDICQSAHMTRILLLHFAWRMAVVHRSRQFWNKAVGDLLCYLKFLNGAVSRYWHQNLVIMEACADSCYGVFDLLNVFSKQEQDITALDHLSRTQAIHLYMQSCVYADAHRAV